MAGKSDLQTYCVARLGAGVWAALETWYDACGSSPHWELIARNVVRECLRDDVQPFIWDDFLKDLAARYAPPSPCKAIDATIGAKRSYFLLPGKVLTPPAGRLYRYMRLDHLLDYNLKLPITPLDLSRLATEINGGRITGAQMENTMFGKPGSPVWASSRGPAGSRTADDIRNEMGLKHVESNYLAEVSYSLQRAGGELACSLHAPTCLDACFDGAENWIFVKNRNHPGGPDWGYTADMGRGSAGAQGAPEAVHAAIAIGAGDGGHFQLRALGPIQHSPPAMDFSAMLANAGL